MSSRVLSDMPNRLPDVPKDEIRSVVENSEDFGRLRFQAEIDYLTVLNFQLFGAKTFAFAANLDEHLALTELNVPSEYVPSPFKSCLFVFDDSVSLDAFYRIHGDSPPSREGALNVFVSERPSDEGCAHSSFLCVHASARGTHMLDKRQLLVRPEWDINTMLATDWAESAGQLNPLPGATRLAA